ncbi:MAG: hypothetical protein ACRED3_15145, partial [Bradyrhizobium sp.]
AMLSSNIQARDADEIRRLGLLLNVDAVVVGSITDFTQYYPPKIGLAVDWYAVNPSFHPIPAGYGLPWGTPAEVEIPRTILTDAEFALAREQLKTQTPPFDVRPEVLAPPPARLGPVSPPHAEMQPEIPAAPFDPNAPEELPGPAIPGGNSPPPAPLPELMPAPKAAKGALKSMLQLTSATEELPGTMKAGTKLPAVHTPASLPAAEEPPVGPAMTPEMKAIQMANTPIPGKRPHGPVAIGPSGVLVPESNPLPTDWPDPRGFVPVPPCPERPEPNPQREPVMSQIRMYDGHDSKFTECLANYYEFRDDARFGGWQSYLQRKQDFIRFCCYMHITEMLAARGGTTEKRVAWRWPISRYFR